MSNEIMFSTAMITWFSYQLNLIENGTVCLSVHFLIGLLLLKILLSLFKILHRGRPLSHFEGYLYLIFSLFSNRVRYL